MILFAEGDPAEFWWLLIDGAIDLVRHVGREDLVVARMDSPGRWAGGFRAWDEHGTYLATGRVAAPGRVLRLPTEVLRRLADTWFPFGGHLISGLYRTARSIESTARQRDSLITLGTLAAGLAHEINNPASAATRSVAALETTTGVLRSSLRRLADDEISAHQFAALDTLRTELLPGGADPDPLRRADSERALARWLSRHGVTDGWTIAPALAAAGADPAWCARMADALDGSALGPAFAWVASTYATDALLAELRQATTRISELVAAVRSYSQLDRAARQRIDLTEGLDSTLVMLEHKRDEVRIVRDYDADLPQIEAYPGELNQVWTNLIDNAFDAMAGSGTLRLTTRRDAETIVVEVGDTGPGMVPDVAARAFEAFFTTKDVGQGTGLGLDIARRIVVERHGGAIEIESQPGANVLRVTLPLEESSRSRPAGSAAADT